MSERSEITLIVFDPPFVTNSWPIIGSYATQNGSAPTVMFPTTVSVAASMMLTVPDGLPGS